MLDVCHTITFQHRMALFACLLSGWVTTTGRLLGPKMGNLALCLFQEHSDRTKRYRIGTLESNQIFSIILISIKVKI